MPSASGEARKSKSQRRVSKFSDNIQQPLVFITTILREIIDRHIFTCLATYLEGSQGHFPP